MNTINFLFSLLFLLLQMKCWNQAFSCWTCLISSGRKRNFISDLFLLSYEIIIVRASVRLCHEIPQCSVSSFENNCLPSAVTVHFSPCMVYTGMALYTLLSLMQTFAMLRYESYNKILEEIVQDYSALSLYSRCNLQCSLVEWRKSWV